MITKSPRGAANQHIAYVKSRSEPGLQYEIMRRPRDGATLCGCSAFAFSGAPRTCKHIKAMAGLATVTKPGKPVVKAVGLTTETDVAIGNDILTFTRAIAF